MISSILHTSFLVKDISRALDFYCLVLNLETDLSRPNLGYPGAWLNVGTQQIHLLELPNPDSSENRPKHGGRDRHTAFSISKLEELIEVLSKNSIPYTVSKSGRKALFCHDPDGNALEFIESNLC